MDEMEETEVHEVKIINDFWPRWTEKSINEIQWVSQEGKKKTPKKSPKSEAVPEKAASVFTDKEICILPNKYQDKIYCWKRPTEIFEDSGKNIEIYSSSLTDLHEVNSHLILSSYYEHIIDALMALQMCKSWTAEDFQEFGFTTWSPSNHIYSGLKVQQGVSHEVKVNPYGKYVIRLFHCGAWRQIMIDDRMPTDKKNQILMPCIRTGTTLELWPLLITKAILKINFCRMEDEEFYIDQRHTPECKMYDGDHCDCKVFLPTKSEYLLEEKTLQRMNVIFALTGWCPLEINLSGQIASDVWQYFTSILEQYKIPTKQIEDKRKKKSGKAEKGSKLGKQEKSVNVPQEIEVESAKPPVIYPLVMVDIILPPNPEEKVKSFQRSFTDLLCSQYRSTSLYEAHKPQEIPQWKTFRWIYWAMEKNIWKPQDISNYMSLLFSFSSSRKANFQQVMETEWSSMVMKKVEPQNIKIVGNKPVEDAITGKKEKATKKKEKEKQMAKESKNEAVFPTDNWLAFDKILAYLQCIREFHKVHTYEKKFVLTDEAVVEPPSTTSKKKKDTLKSPSSKASKKKDHAKEVDLLEEKFNFQVDNFTELYILLDLDSESEANIDLSVIKSCPQEDAAAALFSFRWYCEKQKQLWVLLTSNFTALKMHFPKGRSVYKLQFDATKFCLRIYTNAPLRIGYFDDLLRMMDSESVRMTKYFENIKKAFLQVIQSVGKKQFPENVQNLFHSLLEYCDEEYRDIEQFRYYVYEKFLEMLLQFLSVLGDSEAGLTMKRLFILVDFSHSYDPNLSLPKDCKNFIKDYNEIKDFLCDCPDQDEPYYTEEDLQNIKDCAAVIIQAAMKRHYVKLLKAYHFGTKQKPQERPNILKVALAKFYEKYFEKEPNLMYDLLRKFFHTTFEDFKYNHVLETPIFKNRLLGKFYEFFKDFKNSLRLLKYPGIVEEGRHWIPLKIGCFYCHASNPTKYILNVSTESKKQKIETHIKVIKCDDLTEVVAAETPYLYTLSGKDVNGYKVVVYMYSDEPLHNFKWTLQVAFPRHINYAHFCDLCGVDKCHCPSDTKVIKPLENYPLRCKPSGMQEFVIFRNQGMLLENKAHSVCQLQIFSGETILIFGFIHYFGEPLVFTVIVTKQGFQRALLKKNFSNRTDFYIRLNPGSYILTVIYVCEAESGLKKLLGLRKKEELGTQDIEGSGSQETFALEDKEEVMMEEVEEEMKELGNWDIQIAYEQGTDVLIN